MPFRPFYGVVPVPRPAMLYLAWTHSVRLQTKHVLFSVVKVRMESHTLLSTLLSTLYASLPLLSTNILALYFSFVKHFFHLFSSFFILSQLFSSHLFSSLLISSVDYNIAYSILYFNTFPQNEKKVL